MGWVDRDANGHIPFEYATIAEVLGERGWNTYMLGKCHLVAADEMNHERYREQVFQRQRCVSPPDPGQGLCSRGQDR